MPNQSKTYGYARVSTADQDLSIQRETLLAAGCEIVREEKRSGTKIQGRDELALLIEFMREGDTLVVTRLDRLARSLEDLSRLVRTLQDKGVALKALHQPIDTRSAAGVAFLQMLGVFAEFETNLRRERQMEGIAKAKSRGVYTGRKPSIDPELVKELSSQGLGATEIAKQLGIGRTSVYRLIRSERSEIEPIC